MNLTTRLRILEQRIRPAEPAAIAAGDTWREAAPAAVFDYYGAVVAAVEHADWLDPDDANDRAHAAHPLLSQVAQAVELEALRGAPVDLRRVQWWLLSDATYRLHAAVAKERGRLYDSETSRQTWRRLYNGVQPGDISTIAGKAWNDRTGGTWVRVWRECGTSDPAVLAAAGLHAAEVALLNADEKETA